MSFTVRSRAVAERFLQSAVVFDDEASFGPAESTDEAVPEVSVDPTEGEATIEEIAGEKPHLLIEPAPREQGDVEVGVNAKVLGDAFARTGLICGFLKSGDDGLDQSRELVVRSARRADIVVLDWSINRDEGAATSEIIRQVLAADSDEEERRLRLIAIYTSRLETEVILDRLQAVVDEFFEDCTLKREQFSLVKGPLRIEIYAKQTAHVVNSAVEDRSLSEDALPSKLVDDFAEMNAGLVPSVALAGLAAIRADTHRVLGVLNSDLDPAYIAQRLLIPDQAEAAEQLVALVAAELRAVMDDRNVGDEAGPDAIKDWLRWRIASGASLGVVDGTDREVEDLDALLKYGLAAKATDQAQEIKEIRDRRGLPHSKETDGVAALFAEDAATAARANDRYAMRLSLRSHYRKPARVLQLGTLIRDPAGTYLLCVQPVCDSVRLTEQEREFIFMPTERAQTKFDIVVHDPEDDSRHTLRVERRPYKIRKIAFAPTSDLECVQASEVAGQHRFSDTSDLEYVWIARLEEGYAQRVAHGLGTELSRVGLSESEWLRRKARD